MSDRIRKDALLRIGEDALVDVGCCLNRFDVDPVQCLSWKSHTFLANKAHILPVRRLRAVQISCNSAYVSGEDNTRGSLYFDGTRQEAFELGVAAIKHSHVEYFTLSDSATDSVTEEEVDQIAAVSMTVRVEDLRLWGRLTHLSPAALYRLMFGFASVNELTLCRFNGNQLTDDHLRECGRRQISELRAISEVPDAGPLAVSDEALMDYLIEPDYGMPERSRAHQPTNVEQIYLEVKHLPLRSQQLGGLRFVEAEGHAEYHEQLENGANFRLDFGPRPVSQYPDVDRMVDDELESEDKFRFTYSQ